MHPEPKDDLTCCGLCKGFEYVINLVTGECDSICTMSDRTTYIVADGENECPHYVDYFLSWERSTGEVWFSVKERIDLGLDLECKLPPDFFEDKK